MTDFKIDDEVRVKKGGLCGVRAASMRRATVLSGPDSWGLYRLQFRTPVANDTGDKNSIWWAEKHEIEHVTTTKSFHERMGRIAEIALREEEGEPVAPPKALDTQVGGSHYKDMPIQPIEYIMANKMSFEDGSVIKYISRWRRKNGLEDLKKCRQTIDIIIEEEEKRLAAQ